MRYTVISKLPRFTHHNWGVAAITNVVVSKTLGMVDEGRAYYIAGVWNVILAHA